MKNTPEQQKPEEIIARLITPQEEPRVERPAPPKEPPQKEIEKKPIPLPKPVPAIPVPARKRPSTLNEEKAPNTMRDIYEPPKPSPAAPPKTESGTQEPKVQVPGVQGGVPLREGTKGPAPLGNSKYQTKPALPDFKDELFDKKIIDEQIAKSAGPHVPSPKDIISFSTKEFRYIGYMARLKDKIESIWVYPREAAEKGIHGDLVITFTIKRDGSLGEAEVTRTSGYSMLDEAALKALKEGQPYWPLPKEWKEDTFTIEGHFVYTYSGYNFVK